MSLAIVYEWVTGQIHVHPAKSFMFPLRQKTTVATAIKAIYPGDETLVINSLTT
jgi:hypothetical protein